jgi:S1-C subfamily serine protease
MFRKLHVWIFVGVATVGVAVAVASLTAQDRAQRENRESRGVMVLDGRGSQLGVMVGDLSDAEAGTLKTGGARIDQVDADSPAEKAGLKAGDIVVGYDGERVRSARQFTRLVQESVDGRAVPIDVMRDGKRQTITATPESRRFSWSMDFDGDRIRREVERGLRGMDNLRELRIDPPTFDFRFDDGRRGLFPGTGRGRLGVSVETVSGQLAEYFGAVDGGALVSSVTSDSPAAKAGLKAGDVITSINGDRDRNADELADEIAQAGDGSVTIGILRDKRATTLTATIPAAPERNRAPENPRRQLRPAAVTRPA